MVRVQSIRGHTFVHTCSARYRSILDDLREPWVSKLCGRLIIRLIFTWNQPSNLGYSTFIPWELRNDQPLSQSTNPPLKIHT